MIREKLVPLPSNPCWYEFTLGRSRSGLLVHEVGGAWEVLRIDFDPPKGTGTFDACWVYYHLGQVAMKGPKDWIRIIAPKVENIANELQWGSNIGLAEYLTLMLSSQTTERRTEPAPEKLNRKRAKAGRAPIPAHTVVTIVPLRFRSQARGSGSHASPRLHYRRSHLRHFKERPAGGRSVWSPDRVWAGADGVPSKGWWVTVVPRFLVGKAELGEVSHEYRVTLPNGGSNDRP
jgi:hypothetical protein